jgi:hypothetical protein
VRKRRLSLDPSLKLATADRYRHELPKVLHEAIYLGMIQAAAVAIAPKKVERNCNSCTEG